MSGGVVMRFRLILTLLALMVIILPISVRAENLSDWPYRIPLAIGNAPTDESQPTQEIQNVVFSFTIDTATPISQGIMRSDCKDIRVADEDGNILERNVFGCNSTTSRIYVLVPSVPANISKQLYLYYGNTSAPAGFNTSLFPYKGLQDSFTDSEWVVCGWTGNGYDYPGLSSARSYFESTCTNRTGTFLGSGSVYNGSSYTMKRVIRTAYLSPGTYTFRLGSGAWEWTAVLFYDAQTGEYLGGTGGYGSGSITIDSARVVNIGVLVNRGGCDPPLTTVSSAPSGAYIVSNSSSGVLQGVQRLLPQLVSLSCPDSLPFGAQGQCSVVTDRDTGRSYKWVVDGGSANPLTGSATTTVSFGSPGAKTVKAKVWDTDLGEKYAVYFPVTVNVLDSLAGLSLTCDSPVIANQSTTCVVSGQPQGVLFTYTWGLAGGQLVSNNGNAVTVRWNQPGQRTVSVNVGISGTSQTKTLTADVNVTTGLNISSVSCTPSNPKAGELVTCTVQASAAAGTITYEWSGPNGTFLSPSSQTTQAYFTRGGVNPVSVKVRVQEYGDEAQSGTYVDVQPGTLSIAVTCPGSAKKYEPVSCTAEVQNDWGTPVITWSATGGYVASSSGPSATIVFTNTGSNKVTAVLSLQENPALSMSNSAVVAISLAPPVIEAIQCTSSPVLGQSVICSVSASAPEGTPVFLWDTTGQVLNQNGNSIEILFRTPGEKTIGLTAYLQEYPAAFAEKTVTVNVRENPVTVDLTCPAQALAGSEFVCTVDASAQWGTPAVSVQASGGSASIAGRRITVKTPSGGKNVVVTASARLAEADWIGNMVSKNVSLVGMPYVTPVIEGPKGTYPAVETTYTVTAPCLKDNACTVSLMLDGVVVGESEAKLSFPFQGKHTLTAEARLLNSDVKGTSSITVMVNSLPKITVEIKGPSGAFVGKPTTYTMEVPDRFSMLPVRGIWILPDGSESDGNQVVLNFPSEGIYTLSYRAWVDGHRTETEQTVQKRIYVKQYVFPEPKIRVTKTEDRAPFNVLLKVQFTKNPVTGAEYNITYNWDFGDGTTLQTDKTFVVHEYRRAGTYTVTMTARDQDGNSITDRVTIIAGMPQGNVDFANYLSPKSLRVPVTGLIKATVSGISYRDRLVSTEWKVNGQTIDSYPTNPFYTKVLFTEPGKYTVSFTASYESGAVAQASEEITVVPNTPPSCEIQENYDQKTKYLVLKAVCKDPDGRMSGYKWDLDDGRGYRNGTSVISRKVEPGATVTIKLMGCDDSSACVEVTKQVTAQ
jgi:hypothetical protein